jgi:sucrose synthase
MKKLEMLFKALQGLQHDGIRLLLSDRIPSGIHLAKQIKLALISDQFFL